LLRVRCDYAFVTLLVVLIPAVLPLPLGAGALPWVCLLPADFAFFLAWVVLAVVLLLPVVLLMGPACLPPAVVSCLI